MGGRETERKKDNLDEKEELAEAGQQRQKAPQDTVIHIPKLWKKHSVTTDGGMEGGRAEEGRTEDGADRRWNIISVVEIKRRETEVCCRQGREEKGQ